MPVSAHGTSSHQFPSQYTLAQRLDYYYKIIQAVILAKQHPITGLLPASVAVNSHGDYRDAWVRDNVYSILCVYGLAMAYRRADEDQGRAYELEHAVVKLMRGLLNSMMKQAHKVELFKNKQAVENALHAKYSTATGDTVVGDKEWGHLQLDATGIFVLCLAEMTASGIQIVFSLDEVDFIQNLVFYIERAYRTPDYGIWERGNKMNHGTPELNSSSIGMVVAALQAINGINLFGSRGGPSSVIHVLPDEVTRNYTTLHSALPRESNSKEIDAALISVISYPAFAVQDVKLIQKTKHEIITKLQGKYGCKRFLRDGHQCELEDTRRLHYEASELKVFEHIECEWPLFLTYFILDGEFSGDKKQVETYHSILTPILLNSKDVESHDSNAAKSPTSPLVNNGDLLDASHTPTKANTAVHFPKTPLPSNTLLVPELYILPKDLVYMEKKEPKSQKRYPNENVPLVWAQSLYMLGMMMKEELLLPSEIDPLGRHLIPYYRSSHKTEATVQVVLIAEDAGLQQKLAMFGVESQTPEQASPITISFPSALREAYSALGANSKLSLSGRPKRPVGTLATCRIYKVQGRLYAFTPHFMDKEEFYMTNDNDYLVSLFEHELLFVKNHWRYTGRPTMIVLLTHEMMGSMKSSASNDSVASLEKSAPNLRRGLFVSNKSRKSLLNFITSLKSGSCAGVRVKLGRIQELVSTSCIESLDFLTRKLEEGYVMKDGKRLSWQQVLGGVSDSQKQDTKMFLQSSMNASPKAESIEKLNEASKQLQTSISIIASPKCKPIVTNGNILPSLDLSGVNSAKAQPNLGRNGSDFKLRSHHRESFHRPMSPLQIVRDSVSKKDETYSDYNSPITGVQSEKSIVFMLGDRSFLSQAIDMLSSSVNLHDQIKILHYILSCHKDSSVVIHLKDSGSASLKELLEEVYQKACHLRLWSVVRYAAAVLRKVVNSLTINVTDLLIRQKYLTIGVEGSEVTVSAPLGPDALVDIIYKHCQDDVRIASLIQEILIYLGSFVRSEPHLFDGILRLRTHFIIQIMQEEVQRLKSCDGKKAVESLLDLAPFEIKALIGHILSAKDQTKVFGSFNFSDPSCLPSPSVFGTPIDYGSNVARIKVQSGGYFDGNFSFIEINGHMFHENSGRGLNVVILSHEDGSLIDSEHFDTHINNEEAEDFAKLIDNLESKSIVVICVKDDCIEQMTEAGRLAIESIGSKMIRSLSYRDSWCIIGRKDGSAVETLRKARHGPTDVLELEISFDKLFEDREATSFPFATGMKSLPSKGYWLRRRKIDGSLQRTPPKFYAKVHRILEKSLSGIKMNSALLPRDPTVSEKTPEELNFALQVEELMNAIVDPAERQIAVECLTVVDDMESRRPEMSFGGTSYLDVMMIIREAYKLFWESWLSTEGMKTIDPAGLSKKEEVLQKHSFSQFEAFAKKLFYDLPIGGKEGTFSFIARAALKSLPIQMDFGEFSYE